LAPVELSSEVFTNDLVFMRLSSVVLAEYYSRALEPLTIRGSEGSSAEGPPFLASSAAGFSRRRSNETSSPALPWLRHPFEINLQQEVRQRMFRAGARRFFQF
jgi:hypothetical protein